MAAERYTRTNQKIYFAGLTLELLKQAEAGEVDNAVACAQAHREAALFHLYGAVLGLCQEITGYYRTDDEPDTDLSRWLAQAGQAQSPTPERSELAELWRDANSWLALLLKHYQQLLAPVAEVKKAKIDPTLAVIQVVQVEPTEAPLDAQTLEQWRQALKAHVLRFRQSLSEC